MTDNKRRKSVVLTTAFLGLMGFLSQGAHLAAQTCVAPPAGLVAWWAGEGDANDKWGDNDGTVTVVPPVTFSLGQVAEAFDFEEGDSPFAYMRVPDSDSLTFGGSYSVEFWIRTDGKTAGQPALVDKFDIQTNHPYPFRVSLNTGDPGLPFGPKGSIFCAAYDGSNFPHVASKEEVPVDNGEFHHAACVYDYDSDPKSITVYIDGQKSDSIEVTNLFGGVDNADGIFFGVRANLHPATDFDGLLDEVSVYTRALTASEIASIYQAGTEGKCIAPVLIQGLLQDVLNLGLRGNGGQAQLDAALDALAQDPADIQGAINTLLDFINWVNAQRDKKVTVQEADSLIEAAQVIIDSF